MIMINEILNETAVRLQEAAPGSRFVLAVVQDEADQKKTAHVVADITAAEFTGVLTVAFPSREDAVTLGTYIGNRIYGSTKKDK